MDAFSFQFSQVSLDTYDTDIIPVGVPLAATIKDVAYRDLAKKGSGDTNIKLVIKLQVHLDGKSTLYDLMISAKQAYLLKSVLSAAGVSTDTLDGVELTAESLGDALVDKIISVTFKNNEWPVGSGKVYKNVDRVREFVADEVEYNNEPF